MQEIAPVITGSPSRPVGRRQLAIYSALVVAAVGYGVFAHQWFLAVMYSVMGAGGLFRRIQPPTRVDLGGISRPLRRPTVVAWEQIAAVLAPTPGVLGVQLRLVNGKQLSLADIPAERSAEVAAIGGKEVLRLSLPKPVPSTRARSSDDVLTT